jgi:hypothetical protein
MDKNPRHFFIEAIEIEANVDADADRDFVTIEFAGRVTPTVRDRLKAALRDGEFEITEKRIA